jgi:hypothetical protein
MNQSDCRGRKSAPSFRHHLLACALVWLGGITPAAAAKIDTVVLDNGNSVTGEIKELQQGKLKYSTDSMGTVYIEWDEIQALTGLAYYRVETSNGHFYFGSIKPGGTDGTLTVTNGGQPVNLEMLQVVLIRPIEETWRDKIDSTLSAGYSYTKSSDIEEFTLAYDAVWIEERYRINFGASARSTDDGNKTTSESLAYTDYRHWLENQHYWLATAAAEQNDELGIDLRAIAGGGVGHRFWRTNRSKLFGEVGAVLNHTENSDGSTDDQIDGLLRAGWSVFVYNSPKRSLDTTLTLFPGITEAGEYRSAFDITFSQELVEDFFWNFGFYHRYDSDVSDEEASNSDYGVVTGLGYEF